MSRAAANALYDDYKFWTKGAGNSACTKRNVFISKPYSCIMSSHMQVPISKQEPLDLKFQRFMLIYSQNRLGDLINSIERDKDNFILWVISIFLGALAGFSLSERIWWLFLLLINALLLLLTYYIHKRSQQESALLLQSRAIEKSASSLGMNLSLDKTWL